MRSLIFALATIAALGAALPASAQWVVLDPGHPGWVPVPVYPGWWGVPYPYPYPVTRQFHRYLWDEPYLDGGY